MKELKRWYQYVEGEPAMCIAPLFAHEKKSAYVICLSSAWKYREPEYMLRQCGAICDLFDLGFSTQRLARIAVFIEDGLEDLVKMKPECAVYDDRPRVIGEADLFVCGEKKATFDLLDTMMGA